MLLSIFGLRLFEIVKTIYKTGNEVKWKWDANNFFLNFYCILKTPGHNVF